MAYHRWRTYVPVARRRANAAREIQKLRKNGMQIDPVEVEGRKIAKTFWGEAWCDHLEQFSDYANRLPRGRTYVRNGSVCHLAISKGRIEAMVSGSELYHVAVDIKPLPKTKWQNVRSRCAGQIGSMLELLQGHLSGAAMEIVTDRDTGLFPLPKEIKLSCDCPDWATMCKHVAAVLYGIGARLDTRPELLFVLRNVNHEELISTELDLRKATAGKGTRRRLAAQDLSDVFGVDIEETAQPGAGKPKPPTAQGASKADTRPAKAKARKQTSIKTRKGRAKYSVPKTATVPKKKTSAPVASAPRDKEFIPTAAAIARLRSGFGMNRSQFADLLGVSPPAVTNWEQAHGTLTLRQRSAQALNRAARLTRDQAWAKLKG
jgi:uncharacterized Zn finger protein